MAKPRIQNHIGAHAVRQALGGATDRDTVATATRYLLQVLTDAAPGPTVEVRVPPYGAVQCVEGPVHTRGTPPNVIEMAPATWIALATGSTSWVEALADARVSASGTRADLSPLLPLAWDRPE